MRTNEAQWRILIQVLAAQVIIMESEQNAEDKAKWIPRIWELLTRINAMAQTFNPSSLPIGLPLYNARSADGLWFAELTAKLTNLFCGAPTVSISRIET